MKTYFIFAGEASGDLHGSALIRSLKAKAPTCRISGVGGVRMQSEEFNCFINTEQFQVMGFSDVLLALPRLVPLFRQVRDHILKLNPDCVILIDYPGFNLRLARSLRKHGYRGKLVQYICPTVWAHGKKRINTLVDHYDLLLTIYPFEAELFADTSLTVQYIGNPLTEAISGRQKNSDWYKEAGLPSCENLVALFPGSRQGEINRHVPQQLETAARLKDRCPEVRFVISSAQECLREPIIKEIQKSRLKFSEDVFIVSSEHSYDVMDASVAALAKSGTVTLELALHQVPTVVQYKLTSLNYFIAKYLLRLNLPFYCIVNILQKDEIFPEYIGKTISTDALADALHQVYCNHFLRDKVKQGCVELNNTLSTASCSDLAVNSIERLF
jgi:lipid-A-disaccharide synthase